MNDYVIYFNMTGGEEKVFLDYSNHPAKNVEDIARYDYLEAKEIADSSTHQRLYVMSTEEMEAYMNGEEIEKPEEKPRRPWMNESKNTMRSFINITEGKKLGNEFYHDVKADKTENGGVNKKSIMKPYTKLNDSPKMGLKESEEINDIKTFLIKHQNTVLESAELELNSAKTNSLKSYWKKSITSINESIDSISKNNDLKELKKTYNKLPNTEQVLETKIYECAEQSKNGQWELSNPSKKLQFNECDSLQGYVAKLSNDNQQTITLIMKESSGQETKEIFSPLNKG